MLIIYFMFVAIVLIVVAYLLFKDDTKSMNTDLEIQKMYEEAKRNREELINYWCGGTYKRCEYHGDSHNATDWVWNKNYTVRTRVEFCPEKRVKRVVKENYKEI